MIKKLANISKIILFNLKIEIIFRRLNYKIYFFVINLKKWNLVV